MSKTSTTAGARLVLDAIEIRASNVHGLGVFACSALRSGELVGNYDGRRLSVDHVEMHREDGVTYLFSLSEGGFIDGSEGGNATRHINHSCEPNCRAEEYRSAGRKLHVRIKTLRAIAQGEELFLDYSLAVDPTESASAYPCYCGASTCRQTLVGP
jgi:uncharacterized protein